MRDSIPAWQSLALLMALAVAVGVALAIFVSSFTPQ